MNAKQVIVVVLTVLIVCVTMARAEDPVNIPDQNLKALVEITLGVSDPTPTDMLGLTSLSNVYTHTGEIGKLTGLEHAANLEDVWLVGGHVGNLAPLAGLTKLRELTMSNHEISNLEPLSGLTNLTWLRLDNNKITDISPLESLTNLTEGLSLMTNQISDISPISGLTNLQYVQLGYNQISDISPISTLRNLIALQLYHNQITDISALAGLTNLTMLHLESNQITDISSLSGLTILQEVKLRGSKIWDLSPLAGLTSLEHLDLSYCELSDVSQLASITTLTDLNLYKNSISDVSPLVDLTNLTTLDLRRNPLSWESYCSYISAIEDNGTVVLYDDYPYNCSVAPADTPTGSPIVSPIDNTNGDSPVTLTFESVSESGGTTLVTSTDGPSPPSGFQLGDTYYDITTTATYSASIVICIDYSDITYTGPPELLKLYHYDGSWEDCTISNDTVNKIICGEVSSLSPFAILIPEGPQFQSLTANPSILWPPNHKMIPIAIDWIVLDESDPDPTVVLDKITMNEGDETSTYDATYDDTLGDGHTTEDIQVIDGVIYLRAERSATGPGRIYTLKYIATDYDGISTKKTVTVTVPHDAP